MRRMPDGVRHQLDVAGATAWQALVVAHADHALRFVALLAGRVPLDEAISRYLDEMDVRDPMASAIRSRVLVALERAQAEGPEVPGAPAGAPDGAAPPGGEPGEAGGGEGLRRFRPDVVMKGIARKVRASEEVEQWIALAIARAEEGVIAVHIDNALTFAAMPRPDAGLAEAVEDYIDTMRISGGRAQAVFQRTMARLADLHLPERGGPPAPATGANGGEGERGAAGGRGGGAPPGSEARGRGGERGGWGD